MARVIVIDQPRQGNLREKHNIQLLSAKPLYRTQWQITFSDFAGYQSRVGSGGRIRTFDLWVMSPTSFQLLHPALCY